MSISFRPSSSSVSFLIACCWTVCSATIDGGDYESDVDTARQLDEPIKAIIGWPGRSATTDAEQSIFFEGLFNANRRRRVSVRPDSGTAAPGNNEQRATAPAASGPTVFAGEPECVLANNGRPCVCYTTDFLDSVSSLLDEQVSQDMSAAAVAMFACQSYTVVASQFVVSPSPPPSPPPPSPTTGTSKTGTSKTGTSKTAVLFSDRSSAAGETKNDKTANDTAVTAAARREVDFNSVVNYQLEKSKDGE